MNFHMHFIQKRNKKPTLKLTLTNLENSLKAQTKEIAIAPKSETEPKPAEIVKKPPQTPVKTLESLKAILSAAEKDKTALFSPGRSSSPQEPANLSPNRAKPTSELAAPSGAKPAVEKSCASSVETKPSGPVPAPKLAAKTKAPEWRPKKKATLPNECLSEEKVLKCKFGTMKISKETFD